MYEVQFKITNTGFRKRKFTVFNVVAQLVEALRYKLKGRGFDSRWCHWNFY
jgi:hypothetical protein